MKTCVLIFHGTMRQVCAQLQLAADKGGNVTLGELSRAQAEAQKRLEKELVLCVIS